MTPSPPARTLRRDLGFWTAVTMVIGTVIGSGIFLVPADMVNAVGSPGMVFLVWIVGGMLTMFGALSYAELSAAMPESGADYVYLSKAYHPLLGFLFGWNQTLIGKGASIAALGTAFATYLGAFVPVLDRAAYRAAIPIGPGGGPFEIRYGQILAMAIILLLAGINYAGARWGAAVQVSGTLMKTALIGGIILAGVFTSHGRVANFATVTSSFLGGSAGFFTALTAALFAFDGWGNAPLIGAEIRNPGRNLPRALIVGTLAVAALYLLTNFGYFRVLTAAEVGSSERVATTMMSKILGNGGSAFVTIAAMVSIFASLNGVILSGARLPYAMARDGYFFEWAKRIHPRFYTPGASLIALGLWSCLVLLSGRYQELARMVIFTEWIFYAMSTAAVIVLRHKQPELARPYRVPGYPLVPLLFVLVALALLYSTLVTYPRESGIGLGIIILGLPFYFHWNRRHSLAPGSPAAAGDGGSAKG